MRRIRKGREPQAWAEYRLSTPGARYVDAPKEELRRALLAEQRHLCCYCMGRIDEATTRIDHRLPREAHPGEQFSYRNLLAACPGSEGTGHDNEHCDVHKRSEEISVDPADPSRDVETLIHYKAASGEIASDDERIHRDLDRTLHLNVELLKLRRRQVLDGFREGFERKHRGAWSTGAIEREIKKWSEAPPGERLPPYCGIVVYYLRKRLAQAGARGRK
ncbi:retron system putative HNH endonuclease [Polyangium aurulentum]|uniref:retron system putative HNH endonuclease n=1 Tax=Polyangium aurulentum TaxID=2567896 RepID=UPI00146C5919|nr:retron system putative HNH endonuclease [Polyangium aurulentum]UQA62734.1 TIGR02646 family protein [Polyangium aurulentum]